jgi:hypothetical protein
MAEQEKQLEEQLSDYIEIAKTDKSVDAAGLAIGALENVIESRVSPRMRRWAYVISFCFPPFGLAFAVIYYFFSDKSDAKRVASICALLTVLAFALFFLYMWAMLASIGTENLNQIQQINPEDIRSLLQ